MCNITLTRPDVLGPVDGRKQATAFPPNYIHSLDASHMLLSAIACNRAGLTFASVHDSFWTHACDVDTMNTVLREAFIRMHESDLITQLHTEFTERYKGYYMYVPSTSARKDQDVDEKGNAVKWVPLTFPAIPKKVTLLASTVFAMLTSRDPLMFDD
jgi:DNA-directed RNA polymerase